MKLLDVWPEGKSVTVGSYLFTAEKIIEFATKFDPQYFHLDAEKAKKSVLGGLCASGWHVCSAWMRLNVDFTTRTFTELARSGQTPPKFGPALGFQDLKWKLPVYAGDTVTYYNTLLRHIPMPNRSDRAINEFLCEGKNQDGKTVITFVVRPLEFL
jgi:acyl dehydratase